MADPKQRYVDDPSFRALVDAFRDGFLAARLTVEDIQDATLLALRLYEQASAPPAPWDRNLSR